MKSAGFLFFRRFYRSQFITGSFVFTKALKINILLSVIIVLISSSCKKEKKDAKGLCDCPNESCTPLIPASSRGFGYTIAEDSLTAITPCFNPENPDEFIYLDNSFLFTSIIKYNLSTKQKSVVFKGPVQYQPKWGTNGWILFSDGDKVRKIKPDGSSITVLAQKRNAIFSDWSPSATRFCYRWSFDSIIDGRTKTVDQIIIADSSGETLDIINENGEAISWPHEDFIIFSRQNGLIIYNIKTKETEAISQCIGEPRLASSCLLDKNKLFITAITGIFTYDVLTNQMTCIRKSCDTRFYSNPSYSSQSNKVILCRTTSVQDGDFILQSKHLCLMNPDGTGEEVINVE